MEVDNLKDIRGLIVSIIKDEFKFLKHYLGEVKNNQDTLNLGRVQATIPELGFFSEEQAIWCWPRQGNSMSIPEKGEWVEIYFIGGDSGRPVYLHYASEVQGHLPDSYSSTDDRIIFESPKTGEYIKYNDSNKTLEINFSGEINITSASAINFLGATEALINGTTFDSWITSTLMTIFNAHVHPGVTVGAGSTGATATPLTAPTGHLSTKIKGE